MSEPYAHSLGRYVIFDSDAKNPFVQQDHRHLLVWVMWHLHWNHIVFNSNICRKGRTDCNIVNWLTLTWCMQNAPKRTKLQLLREPTTDESNFRFIYTDNKSLNTYKNRTVYMICAQNSSRRDQSFPTRVWLQTAVFSFLWGREDDWVDAFGRLLQQLRNRVWGGQTLGSPEWAVQMPFFSWSLQAAGSAAADWASKPSNIRLYCFLWWGRINMPNPSWGRTRVLEQQEERKRKKWAKR